MNYVKMIHMAKNKAGLTEDCYRALLEGACGVSSSKEIKSAKQYNEVRAAFKNLGINLPYDKGKQKSLGGGQLAKAYALWCDLYSDGKVKNKSYSAFQGFIKRHFGDVDILRPSQMSHLIEILKQWDLR